MKPAPAWVFALLLLVGCSSRTEPEIPPDGSADAASSEDAGPSEDAARSVDAGMDAMPTVDAGVDAWTPTDAGPPTASHLWSHTIGSSPVAEMAGTDKYLTVMGIFRDTIDFGDGPQTSVGSWDAFIGSFTTGTGEFRWARYVGGPDSMSVWSGDADQSDNIYVPVGFRSLATVEGGGSHFPTGLRASVIVSYDKDGIFRFIKPGLAP